jgi:hypothetical protein
MILNRAMTPLTAGSIALTDRWFRYWMPYCFQKLTDVAVGRYKHVYLPLNRNYKPLGQVSRQRVRYEDYVDQAMIFSTDPTRFEAIWTAVHDDKLWLYNDASSSRIDYFERFGRLMSQKVRLVGKVVRGDRAADPYHVSAPAASHGATR